MSQKTHSPETIERQSSDTISDGIDATHTRVMLVLKPTFKVAGSAAKLGAFTVGATAGLVVEGVKGLFRGYQTISKNSSKAA